MKFAVDFINEDIQNVIKEETFFQNRKSLRHQEEDSDSEFKLIKDENVIDAIHTEKEERNSLKEQHVLTQSIATQEYNAGIKSSSQSRTTTEYSNQVLYKDDGTVEWKCKCCSYIADKLGDGYAPILKMTFREG